MNEMSRYFSFHLIMFSLDFLFHQKRYLGSFFTVHCRTVINFVYYILYTLLLLPFTFKRKKDFLKIMKWRNYFGKLRYFGK